MYGFIDSFDVLSGGSPYDLVTLEALKAALGITGTTEDEALQRQITNVSRAISESLGYSFARADVIEIYQFGQCCERFPPDQSLVLSHTPIDAVIEIAVDDGILVPPGDYDLDVRNGRIWRRGGAWWGGRVAVNYTGGYSLPDEAPMVAQVAVTEAIRAMRAFAGVDPTVRSVTHADVSVTFATAQRGEGGLSAATIDAIAPLRRFGV